MRTTKKVFYKLQFFVELLHGEVYGHSPTPPQTFNYGLLTWEAAGGPDREA